MRMSIPIQIRLWVCETPKSPPGDYKFESAVADRLDKDDPV